SKVSPKAPLRSGRPIVNSRWSKLTRKAPSSTAAAPSTGLWPGRPIETAPTPFGSVVIAADPLGGSLELASRIDPCHHRHPWPQLRDQRLPRIEFNADGDSLHHLGEVSGGIIGRQQSKARSARRRETPYAAMQDRARKHVDGNLDRLAWRHVRELRLLVVG